MAEKVEFSLDGATFSLEKNGRDCAKVVLVSGDQNSLQTVKTHVLMFWERLRTKLAELIEEVRHVQISFGKTLRDLFRDATVSVPKPARA